MCEIQVEGKTFTEIQYRVYAFEAKATAVNFLAQLEVTGIKALDTAVTKLPEKLRQINLDGDAKLVASLYISESFKIPGKAKDVTIDDVKRVLAYDTQLNTLKTFVDRAGTKDEKPEDIKYLFQAAAVLSLVGSLKETK